MSADILCTALYSLYLYLSIFSVCLIRTHSSRTFDNIAEVRVCAFLNKIEMFPLHNMYIDEIFFLLFYLFFLAFVSFFPLMLCESLNTPVDTYCLFCFFLYFGFHYKNNNNFYWTLFLRRLCTWLLYLILPIIIETIINNHMFKHRLLLFLLLFIIFLYFFSRLSACAIYHQHIKQ